MNEYITEAIVIDKEPRRESDSRVFLYTESLGLVAANATSTGKITSKLAAHLEPLNFIQLRLIQKNNFRIADALKIGSFPKNPAVINILQFVKSFFAQGEADPELWALFKKNIKDKNIITAESMLNILGFNPALSECHICAGSSPRYFSAVGYFLCDKCLMSNGAFRTLLDITAAV